MIPRFSKFRSRQNSARRRSRNASRRRFEMLEARQMLAADMPFAGEVLDQELDAPSDDLSMSAIIKSFHDTAKAVVQGSIDGTEAGAEAPIDAAEADQVFEPAGDYNGDGSIELPPDWIDLNLGAATVNAPSDSFNAPGGRSDEPAEDVSLNFDRADGGVETPIGSFTGRVDVDGMEGDDLFAGASPVDAAVVDQVFELDGDTTAGNLGTSPTTDTLEDHEGVTGDGTLDTQSSIDAGGNSSPAGLLEAETGQETIGPEDTGIEFGFFDWLFGMDYDDVETRDDLPDLRKPTYDTYSLARKNNKSHEAACKDAGVEADGKWGKIFKRVYENDNGK